MASKSDINALILPALRGGFGTWIYYSCLIPMRELGERANYASELHKTGDNELSKFIQRALEGHRAVEIAQYLTRNEDRFFNSLVLAVYGGSPDWLEIGVNKSATPRVSIDELSEEAKDSIGFLRLSGAEKIFAIDGQHRLSGIKKAMAESNDALLGELVPVIFVGHTNSKDGLRRTRRLFTTLNKTAIPVRKKDIIALDEDDVMAITARDLYETDKRFQGDRIAMIITNNLPPTRPSLTTIGNLYDVLKLIFMHKVGKGGDTNLRFNRPSDEKLADFRQFAEDYFSALERAFPALRKYYRATNFERVAKKYRSDDGGHLVFRPMGLELITRTAIALAAKKKITLSSAVQTVAKVRTEFAQPPYKGVIWNTDKGTVIPKGKTLARRLIFYTLRLDCGEETLLEDYRDFLEADDDGSVQLPKRVVSE